LSGGVPQNDDRPGHRDQERCSCAAYRLSLDLWRELERTALLREFDRPQLDHAAEQVARCDAPASSRR
jgi:hypothetical protein